MIATLRIIAAEKSEIDYNPSDVIIRWSGVFSCWGGNTSF